MSKTPKEDPSPYFAMIILMLTVVSFFTLCFAMHAWPAEKIKTSAIVAPNGSGTNGAGTDFTLEAGRGTGSGTPGDIIFYTAAVGSTGTTLQTSTSRMRIKGTGYVGIGTATPTGYLDVNADVIRIRTARAPATAAATGNAGEICWDPNHVNVCIATGTWKRLVTASW